MNIVTLIHSLRTAIHNNSTMQTWCTTNYSRNHKVYVGLDPRNPPVEADYPLVSLRPITKNGGYAADKQLHGIGIDCGIFDVSLLTIAGESNSQEYTGIGNIETFRKYIEDVIVANIPAGMFIDEYRIEYTPIEFFPYFIVSTEFIISLDQYQGVDVFA